MADEITCPECEGTGRSVYAQPDGGKLTLRCRFCFGAGVVGGDDDEPDHDESAFDPVQAAIAIPVWREAGARAIPGCRQCLGTGEVISLGGQVIGGTATAMVKAPCPECSASENEGA